MLYRIRQVWQMQTARLQPDGLTWVRRHLTDAQFALFCAQQAGDQLHAYSVARALSEQGSPAEPLLVAALLHDCGKAPGVPLFHRTLVVLLKKGAPSLLQRLRPAQWGFFAPLARAWYHPQLGAALAAAAGCSPEVVAIVRYHQERNAPVDEALQPLLAALQTVDDVS